MNTFEESIEDWLSRKVPERAVGHCIDLSIVLSTDRGLQRDENQDRVATLLLGAKATGGRPMVAVAVADGMGGMRDGAKCATLTLSSFFHALTVYRHREINDRVSLAASYTNEAVFRFAAGKGGATLCAFLLDHELRPLIIHVGDSRVYSFGGGAKVQRLTTDDSLAEAVGGHGRDLLQFVGMGEGMQPHVRQIPTETQNLAITTDGIHFIDPVTFEQILSRAPELKSASERLSAVARWCGGHDNASCALLNLQSLVRMIREGDTSGVQLWDPFGSLSTLWIGGEMLSAEEDLPISSPKKVENELLIKHGSNETIRNSAHRKPTSRKAKKREKPGAPTEDVQLKIHIERSADTELSNEDDSK